MTRKGVIGLLVAAPLLFMLTFKGTSIPSVRAFSNSEVVKGEFIVVLKDGVRAESTGIRGLSPIDASLGIYKVDNEWADVRSLYAVGAFKSVEANRIWRLGEERDRLSAPAIATAQLPNDPLFISQYHHAVIESSAAYRLMDNTAGADQRICIVDTGLGKHPDLSDAVMIRESQIDDDGMDRNGHGSHVAGIAAAIGNNGVGVAGVAWGAVLIGEKVLNDWGFGSTSDIIAGVRACIDHGADVINLSLGGPEKSDALEAELAAAVRANIVPVCAAGNDRSDRESWPGASENCIGVASTQENDMRSEFSNYGPNYELSAPGSLILSTCVAEVDPYCRYSGTSMSGPMVAGIVAVARRANPGLRFYDLIDLLSRTGVYGPSPELAQNPRVSLYRAILAAKLPGAVPTPRPTNTRVPATPTETLTPFPTDYPGPPKETPLSTAVPIRTVTPTLTRTATPSPTVTNTTTRTATASPTSTAFRTVTPSPFPVVVTASPTKTPTKAPTPAMADGCWKMANKSGAVACYCWERKFISGWQYRTGVCNW